MNKKLRYFVFFVLLVLLSAYPATAQENDGYNVYALPAQEGVYGKGSGSILIYTIGSFEPYTVSGNKVEDVYHFPEGFFKLYPNGECVYYFDTKYLNTAVAPDLIASGMALPRNCQATPSLRFNLYTAEDGRDPTVYLKPVVYEDGWVEIDTFILVDYDAGICLFASGSLLDELQTLHGARAYPNPDLEAIGLPVFCQ